MGIWPKAMNTVTVGAEKTPEIDRFRHTGQVGRHKTMPPERLATGRASLRLKPGKFPAKGD